MLYDIAGAVKKARPGGDLTSQPILRIRFTEAGL
jgi:hypothetical protein